MAASNEKPDIVFVDDHAKIEDTEKGPNVRTIDNVRVLGLSDEDADFYNSVSEADRKKITHKVSKQSLSDAYHHNHIHRDCKANMINRWTFGSFPCSRSYT
jgi:hypothetical protein